MKILRRLCVLAFLFPVCAAWAQTQPSTPSPEDVKAAQSIEQGTALMRAKKPAEAIPFFEQAAALYDARASDRKVRYYSSRTPAETLYYSLQAIATEKDKSSAVVLSGLWGYSLYLKAYCLVDLGRVGEAKTSLLRAVALAPQNSQFLSELGHVYQLEKNWPLAFETFRRAEGAAQEFSPEQVRAADLARAWRGMAYVLVELGRLDEAEGLLRKCLQLNSQDTAAQRELTYVLTQKAKSKGSQTRP
ncbi:MAG: tetratricopeptide repeat protein [Reyranellaceae bacterium]